MKCNVLVSGITGLVEEVNIDMSSASFKMKLCSGLIKKYCVCNWY